MSNRLEQEFPQLTWQAVPPTGPGGVSPEIVRSYLERGRRLRSRAIRNSGRAAGTALVHTLRAATAFVRSAGRRSVRRPPERDCWASSAHRA